MAAQVTLDVVAQVPMPLPRREGSKLDRSGQLQIWGETRVPWKRSGALDGTGQLDGRRGGNERSGRCRCFELEVRRASSSRNKARLQDCVTSDRSAKTSCLSHTYFPQFISFARALRSTQDLRFVFEDHCVGAACRAIDTSSVAHGMLWKGVDGLVLT